MLKATTWPYPVFEDVKYHLELVQYGQIFLQPFESSMGLIVDCSSLRERTDGVIVIKLKINTTKDEVFNHVFNIEQVCPIKVGIRVLCKESKYRIFFVADGDGNLRGEIPLKKLRGIAQLDVLFLTDAEAISKNQLSLSNGTVIGVASRPIILTLDEDWTGEVIPVDWLDFTVNELPNEAFLHVELSGGSQTPKVWLNAKFRAQIETVLLRSGDNSPAALAGSAMRQFFWQQVWEKVVVWALKEESFQEENWPATRISKMWRERFAEHEWQLPSIDNLDAHGINDLSLKVQHCLLSAQNLSRVEGLLRFQPENRGVI